MKKVQMSISDQVAEVCKSTLGVWGPLTQLGMVQEQCAVLIASINRCRTRRAPLETIAAEIADLEIALQSARTIVGHARVDRIKRQKLYRLADLVSEIQGDREAEVRT